MQAIEAKYDIDNNEWLASAVAELDADSKVKADVEKKNAEETLRFVKEIKAAEAREAISAKRKLKAARELASFYHTKPDVEYDTNTNKWLSKTLREIEDADRYAKSEEDWQLYCFIRKIEKRLDKELISLKVRLINEAKAVTLEKQKQNIEAAKRLLEKLFDAETHVEQRFVKKYHGADTVEAMVAMEEKKRCATRKFTGMMHRREKINKRKYEEQASAKARAMRRKFAQRIK